jgi:transcriptional regulator with PAS, ATPase and Fis domain
MLAMETIPVKSIPALEEEISFAAEPNVRVMVSGDSYVFRRFVAHQIHQRSRRARGPFVVITPAALMEQPHLIATAEAGTIFIDLERVTPSEQQELLALVANLEKRDIRLIAGAPTTLFDDVESNRFRDDLYYRLNLLHVVIPGVLAHDTSRRPALVLRHRPATTS